MEHIDLPLQSSSRTAHQFISPPPGPPGTPWETLSQVSQGSEQESISSSCSLISKSNSQLCSRLPTVASPGSLPPSPGKSAEPGGTPCSSISCELPHHPQISCPLRSVSCQYLATHFTQKPPVVTRGRIPKVFPTRQHGHVTP